GKFDARRLDPTLLRGLGDELVERILRGLRGAAVHGAIVAATLLQQLLHLAHECGALVRIERGRGHACALLFLLAGSLGGSEALLLSPPLPLGRKFGLALCRLILSAPLGRKLGLALCRLILSAPLGRELGLAPGCRFILAAFCIDLGLALGGRRGLVL